jgi:hypothetical protein
MLLPKLFYSALSHVEFRLRILLNVYAHSLGLFIHKFHFSSSFFSQFLSRAKFVPDFQPTEEVAQPALSTHPTVPPDEKLSPPTPEEAERIISQLLPW